MKDPLNCEDGMTDHNHVGCRDTTCHLCDACSVNYLCGKSQTRLDASVHPTDLAPSCNCDSCRAVAGQLRYQTDQQEGSYRDSLPACESERERSALPAGLQAELALILGIELSDGGLL